MRLTPRAHCHGRAELHVWEAMPHGMFLGDAPENQEIDDEIRQFLGSLWP